MSTTTIVIGAGPAGLTAAYELLAAGRPDIRVYDADTQVGGISKTVVHRGNRIDIGGHRFFSKSDWVMRWWLDKLPMADASEPATFRSDTGHAFLRYQGMRSTLSTADLPHADGDATMLVRDRLSRILFAGKLFAYPLKIDVATAWKLGPVACGLFALSYLRARVSPIRPEATLEDFFINRFGRRLYQRFFKSYTEKVWGRRCDEISAAWGAQRVKGLSISRAIAHALRQLVRPRSAARETSLIEHFLYPRLGPGQMWETVAARVADAGVPIAMSTRVVGLKLVGKRITEVETEDVATRRARVAAGGAGGLDDADPRARRGAARRRAGAREGGRRRARIPRLHDGRPAVSQARAHGRSVATTIARRCRTTGSTCRSPASRSAASRSSTTGARTSSREPGHGLGRPRVLLRRRRRAVVVER